MQVTVDRGSVVFLLQTGAEIGRLPLAVPIDDVLGLDSQHDFEDERTAEVLGRYVDIWIEEYGFPDDDESDECQDTFIALYDSFLEHLQEDWRPDLLPNAVQAAEQRHLSAQLAPLLERVSYGLPHEPDTVPDEDLLALAAWCLQQMLARQRVSQRPCQLCGRPWLGAASGNPYCLRPAPDRASTCRALKREEAARARARSGSYRAEYKRLHALHSRGRLTSEVWEAWKANNNPADWKRLGEWLHEPPVHAWALVNDPIALREFTRELETNRPASE